MDIAGRSSLANVVDLLLDAVCVVDADGRYLYVSAAFERIFGYAPGEVIGRKMLELVHPDDHALTLQTASAIMDGSPVHSFENRYIRKDGQVVHVMWSARWSEADQARVAVARDVTEHRRAARMETALHALSAAAHEAEDRHALYRNIHRLMQGLLPATSFFVVRYLQAEQTLHFVYFADEHAAAPALQKLAPGTLLAEVLSNGRPLCVTADQSAIQADQLQPPCPNPVHGWLGVPLLGPEGVEGALVVHTYSPEIRYADKDIELLQFVAIQIAAATQRMQMLARLEHAALHDQLTDLPNRKLFHDRLQSALARARREQSRLALLYLDLDLFKQVNDTYGHAIGDLLLQEVANRLRGAVRESDTVGRIGGDEFLLLLNDINVTEDAQTVSEKICQLLTQPFVLAGLELFISPSIGIALYPEHGDDYEQLIDYADEAMYSAKKDGGNRFLIAPGIVERG